MNTKKCKICGELKDIEEFPKNGTSRQGKITHRPECKECANIKNRIPIEQRKIATNELASDPIYKICKSLAGNAYSRVKCKSREYKTKYRNLTDPFGFKDSGEMHRFLYDNFYKDISSLLIEGKIPSVDRIDSSKGYTPENIRILDFTENTLLGIENIKRKIEMIDSEGNITIFNSTTECVVHFGKSKQSSARVKSWITKDGKYKIPEGYKFRYLS
jgi:hypothetical protein